MIELNKVGAHVDVGKNEASFGIYLPEIRERMVEPKLLSI